MLNFFILLGVLREIFGTPDRRFGHWSGPGGSRVWIKGQGGWIAHKRFKRCPVCGGCFWFGQEQENYFEKTRSSKPPWDWDWTHEERAAYAEAEHNQFMEFIRRRPPY